MPSNKPPAGEYARVGLAGAACAAFNHFILVPLDVVKTRMQLDPKLNPTPLTTARRIVATSGYAGLSLGLAPTVVG